MAPPILLDRYRPPHGIFVFGFAFLSATFARPSALLPRGLLRGGTRHARPSLCTLYFHVQARYTRHPRPRECAQRHIRAESWSGEEGKLAIGDLSDNVPR